MKIAALILGALGGLWGLYDSAFSLFLEAGKILETPAVEITRVGGFAAIVLSISGIVGASLSVDRPGIASILMVISGIGGLVAVTTGFIVAGPLLIIGSIFAFIGYLQDKGQLMTGRETKREEAKKAA